MGSGLRPTHGREIGPRKRLKLSPLQASPWDALPSLWQGEPTDAGPTHDFFARPVLEVARDLLGMRLASTLGGSRTVGIVVEAEAYGGAHDPASHAATRRGVTERNRAMFGPAGRAYVYRIYGMHWCLNVVTGSVGDPQAVLIRGLDPVEGGEEMGRRRRGHEPLTAGPGRLCQALGINGELYGHDLLRPPLQILGGWPVPDQAVAVSGRIGVRAAADWPYRFHVRGSAGATRRSPRHDSTLETVN